MGEKLTTFEEYVLELGRRYRVVLSYINMNVGETACAAEMVLAGRPLPVQTIAMNTGLSRPTADGYIKDIISCGIAERIDREGVTLTSEGHDLLIRVFRESIAISRKGQRGFSPTLLSDIQALDGSSMRRPFSVKPEAYTVFYPLLPQVTDEI